VVEDSLRNFTAKFHPGMHVFSDNRLLVSGQISSPTLAVSFAVVSGFREGCPEV